MSLIGCVDTLTDTRIAGWAANDAGLDQQVWVEVSINSRVVAKIPCVTFRADLLAAGIGDGRKAFEFDPSPYLGPGRNNLEVRYAGESVALPRGLGRWVRRRDGVSPWGTAVIAALETYHEFKPGDHVCAVGPEARRLEAAFRKADIPCRRFTSFDEPYGLVPLAQKADVSVCCTAPVRVAQSVRFALDNTNTPGLVAIGCDESGGACGLIGEVLVERGVSVVRFESIAAAPDPPRIFAFAEVGNIQAVRALSVPVLAHIHVPKCAGTSFRALLERHFGPRHLALYVNDTYFVYGDEALRSYLVNDPEIRGFSSHHVRSFPRWMGGREILYITFLRDPIDQFISYMTHVKKLYSVITAKTLLEAVPPDAPTLSLREFARWLLTRDRDIPFRENHNVNFFARHSSPAAPDRLEAAKAALDGFFFVGITERMEQSMNGLRAKAEAAGLDFPPGPAPLENTSGEYRDDLSWINPTDEVGSLLLRSVEKDRQLYEWAVARLLDQ